MRIRVKICCIGSPEEAALAVGLGADALGLVGPMPSGPGVIPLDRAAAIAAGVPPPAVALLLDGGRPDAATPELGGTGRTHDWTTSRVIAETVPLPVFLAGGLRPEDMAEAAAAVHPLAFDVCSVVRRDGRLCPERLRAFFGALRQAEREETCASTTICGRSVRPS